MSLLNRIENLEEYERLEDDGGGISEDHIRSIGRYLGLPEERMLELWREQIGWASPSPEQMARLLADATTDPSCVRTNATWDEPTPRG